MSKVSIQKKYKLLCKSTNYSKVHVANNNMGFSLIEVVVSVAILSLLILPLLTQFIVSIDANAESKRVQIQNILAQNIMEEMKSKPLEEIARDIIYIEGATSYEAKLIDETNPSLGYRMVQISERSSEQNGTPGNYTYTFKKKDKYYFIRENISYNNGNFDALITIDSTPYSGTDPSGNPIGYNTFKMPILEEVYSSNNKVALQTNEKNMALAAFNIAHHNYCIAAGVTPISINDISNKMKKTIGINFTKVGSDVMADVNISFYCDEADVAGCGSLVYSYSLFYDTITLPDQDLYFLYYPSYNDRVIVTKDPVITDNIDIYLFKQEDSITVASETVDTLPVNVNLYNNWGSLSPYYKLKKDDVTNRIYNITVQLFKADGACDPITGFIPGEKYLELESTRGE